MASLADQMPGPSTSDSPRGRPVPWIEIAWFTALLIVCYFPVLRHLIWQWSTDEDVSHGFFVPLVSAYIAWQRRDELLETPATPNYWGLAVIAWAGLQLYIGTLGSELFLQRTAFIFSIAGVILFRAGARVFRILLFPWLMLFFMVPIPEILYTQITFPLQLFASRVAENLLTLLGIPVIRDGNILDLASQRLSVAEACSGIRSLLSLSFLSLVYAYFFDNKVWMRWVLLAVTIPVAILANAARVTITGILSEYRTDLAQGFYHLLEGWIIFIVALVMLMAVHWIINYFYRRFHGKRESSVPAV
jgi:exosortase